MIIYADDQQVWRLAVQIASQGYGVSPRGVLGNLAIMGCVSCKRTPPRHEDKEPLRKESRAETPSEPPRTQPETLREHDLYILCYP